MDVKRKRKNTTDLGKADMKRLKDLSTALMSTENTVFGFICSPASSSSTSSSSSLISSADPAF